MNGDLKRALGGLDWDFVVPRKGYVGPLHWYPGTFVRGLSDAVIQATTAEGDLVLDPFGGIGTTATSAILNGRRVHTIDLNPIASLCAYITSGLLLCASRDQEALDSVFHTLDRLAAADHQQHQGRFEYAEVRWERLDGIVAQCLAPEAESFETLLKKREPNWVALADWIAPRTLESLRVLHAAVSEEPSAFLRLCGLAMLSAVLRSSSSQHASWGHIADNVKPKVFTEQDLGALCRRWIAKAKKFTSAALGSTLASGASATVTLADSSSVITASPATLMLTSPPYAGAIDYVLSQRLSLYLLGVSDTDLGPLVKMELGARRKRFQSTSRVEWSDGLADAVIHQQRMVANAGTICLVLPHKDSGRSAGEDMVKSRLEEVGWAMIFAADRSIHQAHTRQSWTSIKRETLIFFQRP